MAKVKRFAPTKLPKTISAGKQTAQDKGTLFAKPKAK